MVEIIAEERVDHIGDLDARAAQGAHKQLTVLAQLHLRCVRRLADFLQAK